MKANGSSRKSTEDWLDEAILQVQSASISKRIMHLSHVFTRDPNEYFAVNSLFFVCEDELAPELHKRLDAVVIEFFKEHNILSATSSNESQ
jgi:hypothetical protein